MKENVLGLPVTVQAREEMLANLANASGGPVLLITVRCADKPARYLHPNLRARNRTTGCDSCREICWYDPKHNVPGLRVLCTHCAPPPKECDIHASAEQVAELRSFYGSSGQWRMNG